MSADDADHSPRPERVDVLRTVAADVLGDEWTDEPPTEIVVELALRHADPADVVAQLRDAVADMENRYSHDDTVDEIIRAILKQYDDSVTLRSIQAIVRRVAGVRKPKTVKGYVRDAVDHGPIRSHPKYVNQFIIDETTETTPLAVPHDDA